VLNLGQQPVIINSIGWRFGLFRKRYSQQRLHGIPLSQVPPVTLATGQEANFFVPLDTTDWLKNMVGNLSESFPELSARMLRVYVATSVRKPVYRRVDPELRKKLVSARIAAPSARV
jgi:hypothetical protein